MIPIRDVNPHRSFPVVNLTIIVLCSLAWLYEVSLSEEGFYDFISLYGLVPVHLLDRPQTLVTHMFLHGGWLHIIGNLWFLWVFGDNVEDRLGKVRYLLFYILSGLGAGLIQTVVSLIFGGEDVPMVGASGAISGVLGAYMWLFPRARILALVPIVFFLTFLEIPAVFFIGLWVFIQVVNGIISLPFADMGGVAWFAHIGGFVLGYLLVRKFYAGGYRY
ncbi:MAG: rhomboid family intramembrane serine protease [Aquificaceae bacterium]|nr:rhomboid family intramembrane serine protease [Aquificaceae bacterium]MDW8433594.1 rhomboid family intramembrane serine protease [Aquificaceae bacterium]